MIALPSSFIQRMHNLLGSEVDHFIQSLDDTPPVSIRFNSTKSVVPETCLFKEELLSAVPWCENAFYLKQRPLFTFDPHLHAGGYYVQEASSMFLQTILQQILPSTPIRALDLCAAPGGKTTLLSNLLPADSLLVANETIHSRAAILKENVIKWGQDHIIVSNSDPSHFSALHGAFDVILVDAPCSGEGMFRKDHKSIAEWSESNLQLCAERQKRILLDVWDALAPGGYLIYSTCTYNPGENEHILEWLLQNFSSESIPVTHSFENV